MRYPRRVLTAIDGKRILWHMLEYLQYSADVRKFFEESIKKESIQTVRGLLEQCQNEII